MKKKYLALICLAILAIVPAILAPVINKYRLEHLTDQQIRTRFDCDRITEDIRPTDKYCNDPQLYRDDVKKGVVAKSNETSG